MGRTRLCYSATPSTCPICQAPYYQTRIGRPRETCGSRPCVNTFISQQRFTLAKQAKVDVATGVWTRPLPPAPPMYTPNAPRVRVLPDGTIALVLCAGDIQQDILVAQRRIDELAREQQHAVRARIRVQPEALVQVRWQVGEPNLAPRRLRPDRCWNSGLV